MDAPLSIGAFSRMTFLSVKSLRHYHDIGLLEPASIDPDSGYRRYALAQVPIAQVIRRLRDLGVPLPEIRTVVQAPEVATRNAAIIAHLQRMEGELARTRETVASLRALLEGAPAAIPVDYRRLPEVTALAVSAELSLADTGEWLEATFTELRSTLERRGLERAGADSALWANELLEEEHGELVALVPVRDAGDRVLPASEYAVAMHHGSFEDLDQTFAAVGAAVAQRTIGVQGPIREIYLVNAFDTPDVERHRTEICWPIFQLT
jgi:DNA-binding transcriptional MerR regulator